MKQRVLLVVMDGSAAFVAARDYAAQRAKAMGGNVALLAIVEPQSIETWSLIEEAVTDSAFDEARREMAAHEQAVQAITGTKPLCYYRKGEIKATLLSFIEEVPEISMLVLAADNDTSKENPLIQYFAAGKGLRKLTLPLTIVPTRLRQGEA